MSAVPVSALRPGTRFELPPELAAAEPPEARGLARDGVRLLVARSGAAGSTRAPDSTGSRAPVGPDSPITLTHTRFADLGRFLRAGDLLVVNTSATRAAALDGVHSRFGPVVVHLSTPLDDGRWVIELRTSPAAAAPVLDAEPGDDVRLPDGTLLTLSRPFPATDGPGQRLWRTQPLASGAVRRLQRDQGRPIRYGYLSGRWPLSAYQTVFADPGSGGFVIDEHKTSDRAASEGAASEGATGAEQTGDPIPGDQDTGAVEAGAEMPSAGRPFSAELVARLAARGVLFAPLALHCGVSSLESVEPPPAERFQVPARTAALVNWTRRAAWSPEGGGRERGGRVIAVGTTVTRALESAADPDGVVHPAAGWTDLVLGPQRPARVVDGLITGMHDPGASHLLLLEAVAGAELVQRAYNAALAHRYLWHEFGDSCLLIP